MSNFARWLAAVTLGDLSLNRDEDDFALVIAGACRASNKVRE
jgi:hypothetical protein